MACGRRALQSCRFDPVLTYNLVGLGRMETELGATVAAERALTRALAVWEEAPETVDPQFAQPLLYLGRWLAERQCCADAAPVLRRETRTQSAYQSLTDAEVGELGRLLEACSEKGTATVLTGSAGT